MLQRNVPYAAFPVFAGVTVSTTATSVADLLSAASIPVVSGVQEVVEITASAATSFYVVDPNGTSSPAKTYWVGPYTDLENVKLQASAGTFTVYLELACRYGGTKDDGDTSTLW